MKAIFLDFYGTIVYEDDEIISKICSIICDNSNISCNPKEIGTYWWNSFSSMFTKSYGEAFESQRSIEHKSLVDTIHNFKSDENADKLSKLLYKYWEKPDIYEDSKEFLNSIDIPIYILSNIDRVDIENAMSFHDIQVNFVITSEDVKAYKPRPEMFNEALSRLNLRSDDVIHIGDSLTSDVMGAQQLGIRTAWINRKGRRLTNHINPDIVTKNLIELIGVL